MLPNPYLTLGCYVQFEDQSFGVTEKVVKLSDEKMISHVRKGIISGSKDVIEIEASKLKYLARAYMCRVSEI